MAQAPDIGLSDKRQNMVFAQRSEIDRPLDDLHRGSILGAINAFPLEDDLDIGIAVISFGDIDKRLDPTVRSSFACLTIKIHAQAAEDLRHALFEPRMLSRRKRLPARLGCG